MKVIQLRAENYRRIRAVEITPTGDVVKVSGRNAEGKTSVLDAIWAALDHRRIDATQPIHKGAKKAVIRLSLGEITVERVITPKATELKVTAADGAAIKSPQAFLDKLVGELSFDPLAFDRMRPEEQFEELRKAVKVDFDFEANAKEQERTYNARTETNRQVKLKRAEAEGVVYTPGLRDELIDTAAILDRIQAAGEHNAGIESRKLRRASVQQHAEANEAQAERVRAQILALQAELAECEREASTARERLKEAAPLPEPTDISAERAELDRAEVHNRAIEQNRRRRILESDAELIERRAEELSAELVALEQAKRAAIGAAKMPVEGLELGDKAVTYKGFPYAQASAAERLRVSMSIAMAANPQVRVIRISDGSLLDSTSMGIVSEMAREHDFQVWVELVDESGKIGIVIEDGTVAKVNE